MEEPEDQALCLGGEAFSFAVDYEQGTGSPSYQWYSSGTSSGSGVPVAEATSDTFATCFSRWRDVDYCVVTLEGGGCSSIQSSSGAVSVVGDPSISAQPLSLDSLCVGGSLSSPLSVSYTGGVGSPSYQWSDGSGVISDATSPTFLPSDYGCRGRTRTAFRSPWTGGLRQRGFLPRRLRCWRTLWWGPWFQRSTARVLLLCLRFRSAWRWRGFSELPVVRRCWRDFRRDVFEFHASGGRGGHHGLHVCGDAVRGELQLRDGWSVDKCWRRPSLWRSPKTRRCALAVKRFLLRWTTSRAGALRATQWYSSGTSSGSGVPVAEATGDTFTPPVSAAGETWYYCVVTLEGRLLFDSVFLWRGVRWATLRSALSRCRLTRCVWAVLCRRPFRCRIQVVLALRATSGLTVPG